MSVLTNRVLLLNEFFRLVNADASDADLTEHDDSTLEGAYQLLQAGCFDAQLYLIDCGAGSRWAKASSALSFSGSDPDKFAALPADFLRLEATERRTGLRSGTISWGRMIPFERRFEFNGNYFYIRGNEAASALEGDLRVYVTIGAAVPSGLVADYFYRHATLGDSTTVDFPEEDRQLIPAFAAYRASFQSWFSGGQEEKLAIQTNLDFCKQQAWRRSRFSRQPKEVPVSPLVGERWYV